MNKLLIVGIVTAVFIVLLIIAAIVIMSSPLVPTPSPYIPAGTGTSSSPPAGSSSAGPSAGAKNIKIITPLVTACELSASNGTMEVEYVYAPDQLCGIGTQKRIFRADFNIFDSAADRPESTLGLYEVRGGSTPINYALSTDSISGGRLIGYAFMPGRGTNTKPLYINTNSANIGNGTRTVTFLSTRSEADARQFGYSRGEHIANVPAGTDVSIYI